MPLRSVQNASTFPPRPGSGTAVFSTPELCLIASGKPDGRTDVKSILLQHPGYAALRKPVHFTPMRSASCFEDEWNETILPPRSTRSRSAFICAADGESSPTRKTVFSLFSMAGMESGAMTVACTCSPASHLFMWFASDV